MKLEDRVVKKLAKWISFFYKGALYRAVSFYKRSLYSAIIENKFRDTTNVSYASNIFSVWIKGEKYIKVGSNFVCREGLRLEAVDKYGEQCFSPKIVIGDNVDIGCECHIGAINEIEIGNGVLMGSKVYITDHSHGNMADEFDIEPVKRKLFSKGKVIIGDNVWIGDNVVIMPDVIIGNGAIIGANAVVTKNVEPFAVVAGVPAKLIKYLK